MKVPASLVCSLFLASLAPLAGCGDGSGALDSEGGETSDESEGSGTGDGSETETSNGTGDGTDTGETGDESESGESGDETDTGETGDPPGDCPSFEPAQDAKFETLLAGLEAFVSPQTASGDASGLGIAIVHEAEFISAGGVGFQAKNGYPRDDLAVDENTLFWIASTSKFMAAVGGMSLVDEGQLDLQAPVTQYLPNYTEANAREADITMHHLMRMKAGLANDGGCYIFSVSESEVPNGCAMFVGGPETVLEKMFSPETLGMSPYDGSLGVMNITSLGTPGAAPWYYSNWGTMLAGRVMEVADDREFTELMQARVFDPAQMCGATYDPAQVEATNNFAIGGGQNAVDGQCLEPELGHDSKAPYFHDELSCPGRNPNGGVRASAVDMGRFAVSVLDDLQGEENLLSQDATEALFCPNGGSPSANCAGRVSTEGAPFGDSYGYFNFHHSYAGREIYTHGGGRAGFGSLFWLVPEEDFAVAIIGNSGNVLEATEAAAEYALRCYLDDDC